VIAADAAAASVPVTVRQVMIVRFIDPANVPKSSPSSNARMRERFLHPNKVTSIVRVAKKSNRKKNKDNAAMLARMVNTYLLI
jgi:hypothetical protein